MIFGECIRMDHCKQQVPKSKAAKSARKVLHWKVDKPTYYLRIFIPVNYKQKLTGEMMKNKVRLGESMRTAVSNTSYDHNAGLIEAENKTDANYGTASSKQQGDESKCSVHVACSAKNCWPPLLSCKLRNLFYFERFSYSTCFSSFPLASAHLKHFLKAKLAGANSQCR